MVDGDTVTCLTTKVRNPLTLYKLFDCQYLQFLLLKNRKLKRWLVPNLRRTSKNFTQPKLSRKLGFLDQGANVAPTIGDILKSKLHVEIQSKSSNKANFKKQNFLL